MTLVGPMYLQVVLPNPADPIRVVDLEGDDFRIDDLDFTTALTRAMLTEAVHEAVQRAVRGYILGRDPGH